MRMFFCERVSELRTLLCGDVDTARKALAKHVEKLVLTPKETPDGPVFEVTGDVEVFDPDRDGNGVCSTNGGQGRS